MLWVRTEFSLLPWLCVSSRNQLWKGGDAVRFDAREQCRHIADGIGVKFIDLGNVVGFLRAVWEFFVIKYDVQIHGILGSPPTHQQIVPRLNHFAAKPVILDNSGRVRLAAWWAVRAKLQRDGRWISGAQIGAPVFECWDRPGRITAFGLPLRVFSENLQYKVAVIKEDVRKA